MESGGSGIDHGSGDGSGVDSGGGIGGGVDSGGYDGSIVGSGGNGSCADERRRRCCRAVRCGTLGADCAGNGGTTDSGRGGGRGGGDGCTCCTQREGSVSWQCGGA